MRACCRVWPSLAFLQFALYREDGASGQKGPARSLSFTKLAQDSLIASCASRPGLVLQCTQEPLGNAVCAGGLCLSSVPKKYLVSEAVMREEGTLVQREAGG